VHGVFFFIIINATTITSKFFFLSVTYYVINSTVMDSVLLRSNSEFILKQRAFQALVGLRRRWIGGP
jgi:hypothetical protein